MALKRHLISGRVLLQIFRSTRLFYVHLCVFWKKFLVALATGGGETVESIITAIITGGVTLLGVLIANGKSQAVTETKLDELTREVREHNNFARRMPVVEEQIKVINHRIEDLEEINKH